MTNTLEIEKLHGHPDFIHLSTLAGVKIDLRYATSDNFVGRDMYSPFDCAWLHKQAANALKQSLAALKSVRPDLGFVVLDALRPHRVQVQMWDSLQGTGLEMYLANPARGSIHSYGMAVDISLIDETGTQLDMGTGFDELTEMSQPKLETQFVAAGKLSQGQLNNRHLLRDVMQGAGFSGIDSEWWHFDCGDRDIVRSEFTRVE
jgi:zinc D-Ala-D-Ala dipeptidase